MIFTFVLTFIFVNIRTKVNEYTLNIEEDEQELFIEETFKIFVNVEIKRREKYSLVLIVCKIMKV